MFARLRIQLLHLRVLISLYLILGVHVVHMRFMLLKVFLQNLYSSLRAVYSLRFADRKYILHSPLDFLLAVYRIVFVVDRMYRVPYLSPCHILIWKHLYNSSTLARIYFDL